MVAPTSIPFSSGLSSQRNQAARHLSDKKGGLLAGFGHKSQKPNKAEVSSSGLRTSIGKDNEENTTRTLSSDGSEQRPRASTQAASASFIRSRFLNRLGISKAAKHHMDPSSSRLKASSRVQVLSESYEETLKADYGKLDDAVDESIVSFQMSITLSSERSMLSSQESMSSSIDRGVSFDGTVTVHPIPARTAYSDRIRKTMWTSPTQMHENLTRNCVEFAAEGWDWRQVATDEDMVSYAGELIHPVHFASQCSMRNQFLQVMSHRSQH